MITIYEKGEVVKVTHEGREWTLPIERVTVEGRDVWYRFEINPSNRFCVHATKIKCDRNAESVGVTPMGLLAEHFWSFDWPWEMTRLRDWFYMVKFKGHIVPTTNFAHCYTHIRVFGFYSRWNIRILLKDA